MKFTCGHFILFGQYSDYFSLKEENLIQMFFNAYRIRIKFLFVLLYTSGHVYYILQVE